MGIESHMNLERLKPSRKSPAAGDIFVFQLKQYPGEFWFGRVVLTNGSAGGFSGTILVYLFDLHSERKEDVPRLATESLLVPPIHTNKLPWTKGYFETVANRPIGPGEALERHVFRSHFRGTFFDENGNPVSDPVEPIGEYGLHSYKTIDDAVSKALGIPFYKE